MLHADFEASISCVWFPQSASVGTQERYRSIPNGVYPEAHPEDRIRKGIDDMILIMKATYSFTTRPLKSREKRTLWIVVMRSLPKVNKFTFLELWILHDSTRFWGGCELDANYLGPTLPSENGKYYITPTFLQSMIDWFKDGKTLPKRYVWEIVLGAHKHFAREESLVNLDIEEGITCDVIGDVHGQFILSSCADLTPAEFKTNSQVNSTMFCIYSHLPDLRLKNIIFWWTGISSTEGHGQLKWSC